MTSDVQVKLTKVRVDGLRALATRSRLYPQKDRTMRALMRSGYAEYDRSTLTWTITPLGLTALSSIETGGKL